MFEVTPPFTLHLCKYTNCDLCITSSLHHRFVLYSLPNTYVQEHHEDVTFQLAPRTPTTESHPTGSPTSESHPTGTPTSYLIPPRSSPVVPKLFNMTPPYSFLQIPHAPSPIVLYITCINQVLILCIDTRIYIFRFY